MQITIRLLVSVLVLAVSAACFAQAVEDVGGAGRKSVSENRLVEDGAMYINEMGTLISAPPPEGYKGPPRFVPIFMDSEDRPMALLPCEALERIQQRIRVNEKGEVLVFLSDTGKFRVLEDQEVIVFRVIRGVASRYAKQNYLLIQDAAYKIELRPQAGDQQKPAEKPEEKPEEPDVF